MSDKACPGLVRAQEARNLVELLLDPPPEWLDKPLLRERRSSGDWHTWQWVRVQQAVLRLAAWLEDQGVRPGDRIGLLGHNRPEWLIADFAIFRLGAMTVPAYYTDPPPMIRHVFDDAKVKLVLVEEGEQAKKLEGMPYQKLVFRGGASIDQVIDDPSWDRPIGAPLPERNTLATIIYTSGTTGLPKGVMLSHGNILANIASGLAAVPVYPEDEFLSFLPLAHAFERTVGHFLPVASGARIAYAESLHTLLRDFGEVRPTVALSVPRFYERIYAGVRARLEEKGRLAQALFEKAQQLGWKRFCLQQQGKELAWWEQALFRLLDEKAHAPLRARLGGRLRLFVSGGVALAPQIARFLLSAGITVLPGYGLTEASPIVSVNREEKIKPETVGPALAGVEVKLAEDGELLVRGDNVMQGYWQREEETKKAIDEEGFLHTGDVAQIDEEGFIRIIDRKKEIMVLTTGENVPPAVVEQHLVRDPVIEQAMIVADNRPFVAALIVPNIEALQVAWQKEKGRPLPKDWHTNQEVHAWMLARMRADESDLPSYAQVKRFAFVKEQWTQEDGLLTPTMKLKRRKIIERHQDLIESLYSE